MYKFVCDNGHFSFSSAKEPRDQKCPVPGCGRLTEMQGTDQVDIKE